ncbi:Peptidase family M48 [Chitinophaga sp. CF118]|uniref:M48 family metallopeptidase n=1 Tax=Chitinophaga sp. CF118 TaxID=1884367 RepID=UPI0008E0200A|nr:M48 family metallopeptidase [Chitinophaga sp. CF118]SFF10181.1 Peptidase family M48 [Chitinophaga sp. CF118]
MFKGYYYNHQVAKAIPVTIQLFTESLQLELTREEGMPSRKLQWLFTEIDVQVVDRNFLRMTYTGTGTEAGTLEVNDPVFVKMFLEKHKPSRSTGIQQLVLRGGLKVSLIGLALMIGLLLAGHFFILPWCADKVVDQLPLSFDKKLGQTARNSVNETVDSARSRLLTDFAAQMKWETTDSLTFSVVPSNVENAYALPGGYVVVYTGLLEKLHTKEQLAALLAHEVAHVTCRHSVRKLCRDMSSTLLVTLVFSNSSGATSALYSNANSLYSLTYSRQYEQQADLYGMQTLRRNHIDQHGMLQLLQELKKLDNKLKIPEFISTHPLTNNRIQYVERNLASHPASYKSNDKMEEIFRQLQKANHK